MKLCCLFLVIAISACNEKPSNAVCRYSAGKDIYIENMEIKIFLKRNSDTIIHHRSALYGKGAVPLRDINVTASASNILILIPGVEIAVVTEKSLCSNEFFRRAREFNS